MNKKLAQIFDHFGEETQKKWAGKESSELCHAIFAEDMENMIEEMADVAVIINQFMLIYPEIKQIMKQKVDRTLERIASGYYTREANGTGGDGLWEAVKQGRSWGYQT